MDGSLLMQVGSKHIPARDRDRPISRVRNRSPRHKSNRYQPPKSNTASNQARNPTKEKASHQETKARVYTIKWTT